ncbi:MAG: hypothetical protein EBU90_23355 [Proteobacteria bacterium]|nr:hypothetical protein [Pseudomonadota bacterium]
MKRLKKEFEALKRENQQLRRLLNQFEEEIRERERRAIEGAEDERQKAQKAQKKKKGDGDKCIKCGSATEMLDLGTHVYKVCTDKGSCWHRQRIR